MENDQPPPQPPANVPDAPDAEKMDQIRRRRMEKLAASAPPKTEQAPSQQAESPSVSKPATPTPAEPTSKPKINITKVAPPSNSTNPFTQLGVKQSNGSPPAVRLASDEASQKRARAESGEQSNLKPPPKKTVQNVADESIEEYENRILGQIFRITLDPNQRTDSSSHKLIHLPNLRQELEEGNESLNLSVVTLDSAILEACSTVPQNKPILDYLLPCWKRTVKALKGLRGYANAKDSILREARRLCMSYSIFAVTMPELFNREPNALTDSLTPYLLHEPEDDRGICPDFLTEAVSRFQEDDSVKNMLVQAVAGLSYQLSSLTMNDNYRPYIQALKRISHFPPAVTAIAESPLFVMAQSAPGIEKHTLLGPFFRISPLQPEVTKTYFDAPKTMDKRRIITAQEALRLTLNNHQQDLLDIINMFVRASPKSKNRTLDWFAYTVNANHKRRALQMDTKAVSSDGFLMNVTVLLDGLCEPFMDTTFSKISRIDVDYLRRTPRVDIHDETKLNADENAANEYYSNKVAGESNFISEVFFLTLAAHHYGSEGTNANLKNLEKDIKHIQKRMVMMEAERPKLQNNPTQLALFDAQVKKYNETLERAISLQYAIQGVLFDKKMQQKSLTFMRYVTVWLLRVATKSDYTPEKSIKLPLADEQPEAFKYLPEYVLEDIVGNFNFIFRYVPDVMISAVGDEIMTLCITFLTNSTYIRNPYLKAKLVSLLFHGTWPVYHRTKGVLGDSLTGTKFANEYLLHALLKFYIECEQTGAHTQFYDKFNIRYEIFQVIKCIWTNDVYKQKLTQESKTNLDFFIRFVNLLLNDATYVLDESLTKFPKIHDLQIELRGPQGSLTPEQRTAKEEELQAAEGQASSYMQLVNETMSMMKLFTGALSEIFTMKEIVQRLADMLDYNLDSLTGPKSSNLKVEDPKKYGFDPRALLSDFVEIYINLSRSDKFVEAVAKDGRSYKPANFDGASRIMTRHGLKTPEDMKIWENLKERFALAKALDDEAEEDLGEVPDEFLDPIMGTLMEDPVILPTSRTVMDRSTIRQHLLSDQTDMYNRQPLKIEEVIDNVELKAQIDAFKQQRKAEKTQKVDDLKAEVEGVDRMDTSSG